MKIDFQQFAGTAPLVSPEALAEKFATVARDVRFDRGVLTPGGMQLVPADDFPDAAVEDAGIRAVAKVGNDGTRFAFNEEAAATAFLSPQVTDEYSRVYFMGPQGPSFTSTNQYAKGELNVTPIHFRLGMPAPASAPAVPPSAVTINLNDGADEVDVAYAFSYVDTYGHEGPLSPGTRAITLAYNRSFAVKLAFGDSLPGRVDFSQGFRRIYRATYDGASQAWQYLVDVPVQASTYTDRIPMGQEAEEAVSIDWFPPPNGMTQLCMVGSAFAAGIYEHYVCFSAAKLPHAWPPDLHYPLKYQPVKIMPTLNGLFVATNGRPYWAAGVDPYSAVPVEMGGNAPCLSPGSVVDMGGFVIYASPDGFMKASPDGLELLSAGFIDREGMEALVNESCRAFEHDRRYVFSTADGRWLAFDPDEGFVEYSLPHQGVRSVTTSVRDNRQYFVLNDGTVRQVDFAGEGTEAEWVSRHVMTDPDSFGWLRVVSDTYPVGIRLRCRYGDGGWRETPLMNVKGPTPVRLPAWVANRWEVGVVPPADGRVRLVTLAQSGEEVS